MAHSIGGFFKTALSNMVEARQREANRYVTGALLMLDDETLARGGYNRADLKKRATHGYII